MRKIIGAFLPRATDLDTLVVTAISVNVWDPTWKMLGKIKDYGTRNDVAAGVVKNVATIRDRQVPARWPLRSQNC